MIGLTRRLRELSGIEEIDRQIDGFQQRADALKAGAALARLEALSFRWPELAFLRDQVEAARFEPGMHVLDLTRAFERAVADDVELPSELLAGLDRLVTAPTPAERMGLADDAESGRPRARGTRRLPGVEDVREHRPVGACRPARRARRGALVRAARQGGGPPGRLTGRRRAPVGVQWAPADRRGAPMAGWILAIDFGTTSTAAAMQVDGSVQRVEVDGAPRMPSLVFWREGTGSNQAGRLVLGEEADELSSLAPWCLERTPKRRIGDETMRLGEKELRVTEVIGAILRKVADEAVRTRGGEPPSEVRLTYPARWSRPRLDRLREAARDRRVRRPGVDRRAGRRGDALRELAPVGRRVRRRLRPRRRHLRHGGAAPDRHVVRGDRRARRGRGARRRGLRRPHVPLPRPPARRGQVDAAAHVEGARLGPGQPRPAAPGPPDQGVPLPQPPLRVLRRPADRPGAPRQRRDVPRADRRRPRRDRRRARAHDPERRARSRPTWRRSTSPAARAASP